MKVLLAGGGTGGHVYPAIAIANKIKEVTPELCRVADGMHRRLDRVLEQKPVNDGVRNGLHLQKTNSKP